MFWSQSLKLDSRDSFELELLSLLYSLLLESQWPTEELFLTEKLKKVARYIFFPYTFLCLSSAPFLDWEKKEITARKAILQNFLVGQKQH